MTVDERHYTENTSKLGQGERHCLGMLWNLFMLPGAILTSDLQSIFKKFFLGYKTNYAY